MKLHKSVSAAATQKLAKEFAREILKNKRKTKKGALVIGLTGDLGAGKTTFMQGFLRGLGVRGRVTSPTFLIIRRYSNVYHIDAYRIRRLRELRALGVGEIIRNSKNIVVIEWAENVRRLLPKSTVWIRFHHGEREKERLITYENHSSY